MKNVAVLGSGQVGETSCNGLLEHGYAVMRASREPSKLDAWKTGGEGRGVGRHVSPRPRSGATSSCSPSRARRAEAVVDQAGVANLAGKTVIDATNPIANEPPRQRRDPLLHERERVADGAPAEEGAAGALREGVQLASATRSWSTRSSSARRRCSSAATMPAQSRDDRDPRRSSAGRRVDMGGVEARASDRVAVHAVVHPGLPPQRLGARVQVR